MSLYTSTEKGYRPGRIEGTPIKSKPEKSNGKYKFSKRVNRLEWSGQIEPLFAKIAKNYRPRGNQHYGKISIIKEIRKNGETEKIEKEINIRIDFRVGRPCFLSVENEEDLEAAYRKVLSALSGDNYFPPPCSCLLRKS